MVAKLEAHRRGRGGDSGMTVNEEQVKSMELSSSQRHLVLKSLLEDKVSEYGVILTG